MVVILTHNLGSTQNAVKFENIMFEAPDLNSSIKILDFGLSKKFASGKHAVMKEGVGTM